MKRFAEHHPTVLFFYFLSVIGICMFLPHPLLLAIAFVGGILACLFQEPPRRLLVSVLYYIPVFLLITAANPLFSHRGKTILFYFLNNPVTKESILYGANLGLMLITVMCWFRCFGLIFTSDKLLCLFGNALPKTALLLSMTFRFIPMFRRRIRKISDSGKVMGLYSEKGLKARLSAASRVFLIMLSWSLEQGIDTAAFMNARGYALPNKSRYAAFRPYRRDWVLLTITLLLLLPVLVLAARGALEFQFYPDLHGASPSAAAAACTAYGLLCLLPFFTECKENLQWNYFVSKV